MNIPLDKLYHFIENITNDDVLIYRFWPHGSKNLTDLNPLHSKDFIQRTTELPIICHDQEPLNYSLYQDEQHIIDAFQRRGSKILTPEVIEKIKNLHVNANLRLSLLPVYNFFDRVLLLHSEKRSYNLDWYQQNGFIGVYWWAHAIIARDWFRYASIDPALKNYSSVKHKDFLIYNRAWSGTREYRLKFAELLIKENLVQNCEVKFQPHDNGQHYSTHVFENVEFQIDNFDIENHITHNTCDSTASADYVAQDYENTNIEIVLETLFDDQRWHLTEKALRPIACGQPFMLAGSCNILEYLRSYGFETFSPWINEEYDSITNSAQRLWAIVAEMRRIVDLPITEKQRIFTECKNIALRNKKRFFSDEFFNQILDEFVTNYQTAKHEAQKSFTGAWFKNFRSLIYQNFPEHKNTLINDDMPGGKATLIKILTYLNQHKAK